MATVPDRNTFESAYAGAAPWDIAGPQQPFVDAAPQIVGAILDSGCGTGENALYFAGRGHRVTGIDYLAEPIGRAQRKAAERGLTATFLVMDALTLSDFPQRFDSALDSGLFHVFTDEDRRRYVAGLTTVVRPGGRLFLLAFSDAEPGTVGPRRIAERELREAFALGWQVVSITPARFAIRPEVPAGMFSAGGPKAWFAVIRRAE